MQPQACERQALARAQQKSKKVAAALEHQAGVLEAQLLQARADLTRVESLLKTGAFLFAAMALFYSRRRRK